MINVTDRTIRRTMELLKIHKSYIHFDKPNGDPINDEANLRYQYNQLRVKEKKETMLFFTL